MPSRALGVLLFVVVLIATACENTGGGTTGGGGDGGDEAKHLVGHFVRWEPVDDKRGYVYFTIKNNGTTTETTTCTVKVSNDFGNFGFDYMVGEPVPPGKTINGRMALDVGDGSMLINTGEITDC